MWGKKLRRRCLSLFLAAGMVLTMPAVDGGALQGILPELVKQASAASETIDSSTKLEKVIGDANLLSYLKEQLNKQDATVGDLGTLTDITVPAEVFNLKGLGYALNMTKLDLSQCSAVEIPKKEFQNCKELTAVVMSDKIITIQESAFSNCLKLKDIDLSKVTTIEAQAFGGCSSLSNASYATLKDEVKMIDSGAFNGCSALTKAKVPKITEGVNVKSVPAMMFNGCTALTNVIFCDPQLQTIHNQAFAATGALTFGEDSAKKLPDTVTVIEDSAFSGSAVEELDLSNLAIAKIAKSTFFNTTALKKITLPSDGSSKLTEIAGSAFEQSAIESITMPNTVTTLGEMAFKCAANMKEVKLSIALTELPAMVFQGAGTTSLNTEYQELKIQGLQVGFNGNASDSKLETIGASAFNASTFDDESFMKGLTKLKTIKESAFSYVDAEKLTIPACVETVEKNAFIGEYWLQELDFAAGSKVTVLPETLCGADQEPSEKKTYAALVLEKVVLPEHLKSIGAKCFKNCFELHTVGYGSQVKEGEWQFPSTLEEIGDYAFMRCGLYEATQHSELSGFYTDKYCMLPLGINIINKVVIPDAVSKAGIGVFQKSVIERLEIGEGITEIPASFCQDAGYEPYQLENDKPKVINEKTNIITTTTSPEGKSVDLPNPEYKPIDFVGLKSVQFPKTLKKINTSAFSGCYALEGFGQDAANPGTDLGTPELQTIGDSAFTKCKSLKGVLFPSSLESIGNMAFKDASVAMQFSKEGSLTRPNKKVAYQRQFGEPCNMNLQYATSLKTIGTQAFSNLYLTDIYFPDNVTKIPDSVCSDCYHLKTVTMSEQVTEVGANAFKNAYNLQNVKLPLTAAWAPTIFEGATAYKNRHITIVAAPAELTDNVYMNQEHTLSFSCVKNFTTNAVSMAVKDLELDVEDSNNDLLKHADANKYVTFTRKENSNDLILKGKTEGKGRIRVSAQINLAGDMSGLVENNPTALSDTDLTLQVNQDYMINVTKNPIGILQLSCKQLVEEANRPVIYLGYGETKPVPVTVTFQGKDTSSETTDILSYQLADESIAKINATSEPVQTKAPKEGDAVDGKATLELLPVALGNTTLTVLASSGEKLEADVRVRIPASNFTVKENDAKLDVGDKITFHTTVTYSADGQKLLEEEGNDKYQEDVRYYSSDESIATVDPLTGEVTAIKDGTVTITMVAPASGRQIQKKVTVQTGYVPDASGIELSVIEPVSAAMSAEELSKNGVDVYIGDPAKTLKAVVLPENAVQKVTWKSSDETVATISETGEVKGLKIGTATITATSENGKTGTCKVTVKQHVSEVKMKVTEITLTTGSSKRLEAEILPDTASDKKLTWSSDNDTVAMVDASNGTVNAVGLGTATITATVDGKSAACTVNVKAPTESIELSAKELAINVGETGTLTASVLPAEADQNVVWTSSNEGTATVADGVVTGLKVGSVTITAKTSDGKSATCSVKIKNPVTEIKLSETALTLSVGKSQVLKAEVLPKDATDTKVTWSSDNEEIAKVDKSSGNVTAIKVGTAKITATADGKSATCTVTVKSVPTEVKLSADKLQLQIGQQKALTGSVLPADADQTLTWTSSDENIATVVNGLVTAVKEGSCTITATTSDKSKTATCALTVTPKGPGKVKLKSAKNVKKKAILVKWKAVKGAEGYQVSYGKKLLVTKTSVKIKKLKKKKTYKIKVRAYFTYNGTNVFGKWSKTKKVKVKK